MSLPYAVVTFIDDTTADPDEEVTSEVPSSWLTKDKQKCWWPTMKNVTLLISKQVEPDPNDEKWKLCDVKFEAYFDTLEKARKKAESISSSSDENDVRNRGRGKRKKNVTLPTIIDDSSDNSEGPPRQKRSAVLSLPPDYNIPNVTDEILSIIDVPIIFDDISSQVDADGTQSGSPSIQCKEPMKSPSRISVNDVQIFDSPASTSRYHSPCPSTSNYTELGSNRSISLTPSSHSTHLLRRPTEQTSSIMQFMREQSSSLMEFMKDNSTRVLAGVAGVKVELRMLNTRLEKLENQTKLPLSSIENQGITDELNILPFQTTEQIVNFEKKLLDQEEHPTLQSDLMRCLSRVGGNGMKDNTVRVFKKVFSNKVAIKASWLGLRNNFQISTLNITKIIKDAVAVKYPHTDKEFEELASEWFRQANQRYKRELKNR